MCIRDSDLRAHFVIGLRMPMRCRPLLMRRVAVGIHQLLVQFANQLQPRVEQPFAE